MGFASRLVRLLVVAVTVTSSSNSSSSSSSSSSGPSSSTIASGTQRDPVRARSHNMYSSRQGRPNQRHDLIRTCPYQRRLFPQLHGRQDDRRDRRHRKCVFEHAGPNRRFRRSPAAATTKPQREPQEVVFVSEDGIRVCEFEDAGWVDGWCTDADEEGE